MLFFMTHLGSYNNIFDIEAQFWGNKKVLFGGIYAQTKHLRVWILHVD